MAKAEVYIEKCSDPYNERSVEEATRSLLELFGGMETLISQGDTVVIKPNVGVDLAYQTGATTNPFVVGTLVKTVKEAGAKKIISAEGSIIGQDTIKAFEVAGFDKLAKELNCELFDLKRDSYRRIIVPGGKVIRRISVPETLIDADISINVPVMKTHDAMPITLGLKNMKGMLRDMDKKRFHKLGLSKSLMGDIFFLL